MLCKCGCNQLVNLGRTYVNGHNGRYAFTKVLCKGDLIKKTKGRHNVRKPKGYGKKVDKSLVKVKEKEKGDKEV